MSVGFFCPVVRLSREEFNLVPEIPIMQKWKMKARVCIKKILINFLASSLITLISYEAL